jgi:hypothetical protein
MKSFLTSLSLSAALAASAFAQIAFDTAANYTVFSDGSNGGTGFLPWSISSNNNDVSIFAGSFLGDSTDGAGNINSAGQSFGLYANPGGAFVTANRGFASALLPGQTFSLNLGINFDNGNKGFVLFAGTQGEVFNFNVGSGGSVSSANALINPGAGAGYNYGGDDAVITIEITVLGVETLSYEVSRNSESGNQGILFSGLVSGLFDSVTGFGLYNSGTDNGSSQNNLYFNDLTVVPEPGTYALLLGFFGLCFIVWQRRRSA